MTCECNSPRMAWAMSIVTSNTAPNFSPFPIRRCTVDEYHRLAELSVLSENDRVDELAEDAPSAVCLVRRV